MVCVSWKDAKAYVDWLSGKTGKGYRLLSEAEWEYVARGGTRTSRYWGAGEGGQCEYANGAASCRDRSVYTAEVGSYRANGFGLHDVLGNVWEWVEDCWHEDYTGAPVDGSAWTSGGECGYRVLRGGSWVAKPRNLRSAIRIRNSTGNRVNFLGFRIARTLTP